MFLDSQLHLVPAKEYSEDLILGRHNAVSNIMAVRLRPAREGNV